MQTYDRTHRAFHWTMAAIILAAVALGFWASLLVPGTPLRKALLELHKSLGFTAAILILPRIAYRLLVEAPPPVEGTGPASHLAATAGHLLLYGLMIFMPITGYMFSAAGGYSLPWFGLFQWPRLLPLDRATASMGEWLHDRGAWLLYGVIALHLAAVAWHSLVRKDAVLARMLGRPAAAPRA